MPVENYCPGLRASRGMESSLHTCESLVPGKMGGPEHRPNSGSVSELKSESLGMILKYLGQICI